MLAKEHLVEQHIREYESRQRHVDELLERAHQHVEDKPEIKGDLTVFANKRDELADDLTIMKQRPTDGWAKHEIEESAPLHLWHGLVNELESLIERIHL